MKLDEVDLDRYWRFALPVAVVGLVLSGVVVLLVVALSEPPDVLAGLVTAAFAGAFPVHLGTVLTNQRIGPRRRGRSRGHDRSVPSWIGRSVVSAAVFLAALQWHELWIGPDREWLLAAAPGLVHAVGVSSGLRYRRTVRAWGATGSGGPDTPGPATVVSSMPPPAPMWERWCPGARPAHRCRHHSHRRRGRSSRPPGPLRGPAS